MVGETGLKETAGVELMALDTTEEASTCWVQRSALGLVGSSEGVGEWRGQGPGKGD